MTASKNTTPEPDDDLLGDEKAAPLEGTVIPAGAKRPQDRKPKAAPKPQPKDGEIAIKVDGVDLVVQEDALDDFELLDDMSQLEVNQNAARLASVLRRLLGPDQFRVVMDHLRDDKTNRVSIDKGGDFVMAVLEAVNPSS